MDQILFEEYYTFLSRKKLPERLKTLNEKRSFSSKANKYLLKKNLLYFKDNYYWKIKTRHLLANILNENLFILNF